jgi:hypothetical protein
MRGAHGTSSTRWRTLRLLDCRPDGAYANALRDGRIARELVFDT